MTRALMLMLLLLIPATSGAQQFPEEAPAVEDVEAGEEPDAEPGDEGDPAAEEDSTQVVGVALYIGGGAAALFLFLVVGGLAVYFARRHPSAPNVSEV